MFGIRGPARLRRCAIVLGIITSGAAALAQHASSAPAVAGPTTRPSKAQAASQPARKPFAASAPAKAAAERASHAVESVVDGVTIRIVNEPEPVRLAGVLVPPGDADANIRAAEFLAALLVGESVYVDELPRIGRAPRGDGSGAPRGVRAIVCRAPDGVCANIEAVRQGFARFDDDESLKNAEEFRAAERVARQAKKGIWSEASAARSASATDPHSAEASTGASVAKPGDVEARPARPSGSPGLVYVTRTGTKYHTQACRHARNGASAITLAEARERKLKPCTQCKPPE